MKHFHFLSLCLFVLAAMLPAQNPCTGYPSGVVESLLNLDCNEISPTGNVHFSLQQAPSEQGGQMFTFVFNNVPTYPTEPAIYSGLATLSFNQITPIQFPGAGPTCLWATDLTIFLQPIPVLTGPGCTSVPVFVFPAVPGLAGLVLYAQFAMHDGTQGKWAVTNQLAITIQP